MTTSNSHTHDNRRGQALARQQGAAALREAHRRVAAGLDAADACGWALAMLPESRAAQRLMLDWLLSSGQNEETATRASALLRTNEGDWRLWLRKAHALLALDRAQEALQAIDRALAQRPDHRGALLLAAEIACRLGDPLRALAGLEHADQCHPRHPLVAHRLIDALLAADRADDAAAVLEQAPDAAPQLQARVLTAQGRLLDARLLLEEAIHWELDEAQRDCLRLALIDVLEAAADYPALRALSTRDEASPVVAARLAESCLSMGAFLTANDLMQTADAMPSLSLDAAAALAAATEDGAQAICMLASPRMADRSGDSHKRIQPWLRTLLGLVVAEQVDARGVRRASADPALNVLETILPEAIATFDAALRDRPDAPEIEAWLSMRRSCALALQQLQRREAPMAEGQTSAQVLLRAA